LSTSLIPTLNLALTLALTRRTMRRILCHLATAAATPNVSQPEPAIARRAAALQRRWFSDATALDAALDAAIAAAAQEGIRYAKRSRHEAGKEEAPWEERYSPRRYPAPMRLGPPADPLLVGGAESLADAGLEGPSRPRSGFALSFSTLAPCAENGVVPYGEQRFPAVRTSGSPEANFVMLPFPLELSSCQAQLFEGQQTTRDRPFTISESLMKQQMEQSLRGCLAVGSRGGGGDSYDAPRGCTNLVRTVGTSVGGANCSTECPEFLRCVDAVIALENFTRAASAHCQRSEAAAACTRREPVLWAAAIDSTTAVAVEERSGGGGACLTYECLACVGEQFFAYFDCAIGCLRDSVSISCVDCSFTYAELHRELLELRKKLWHAYFLGAFSGLVADTDYVLRDLLDANVHWCADNGTRCATRANFDCQFYGTGGVECKVPAAGGGDLAPPAAPPTPPVTVGTDDGEQRTAASRLV